MAERLTKAQLRQFGKDGYLSPLPLFPYREIRATRRMLEHYEALNGSFPRRQVLARLSRFKPHLLFHWLDAICHHPGVLDAVESIIGPDILIFGSGVTIKNVGDTTYTPWHQPAAFTPFSGGAQVRVVVAVTACTANSGGGCVLPGSHRQQYTHQPGPADAKSLLLRPERIAEGLDEAGTVLLEMKAGEMAILDHRLATCAGSNEADDRRIAYEITYVTPDSLPDGLTETAGLARGAVGAGKWLLEPRPEPGATPHAKPAKTAEAAYAAAMAVRWENFSGIAGGANGHAG